MQHMTTEGTTMKTTAAKQTIERDLACGLYHSGNAAVTAYQCDGKMYAECRGCGRIYGERDIQDALAAAPHDGWGLGKLFRAPRGR